MQDFFTHFLHYVVWLIVDTYLLHLMLLIPTYNCIFIWIPNSTTASRRGMNMPLMPPKKLYKYMAKYFCTSSSKKSIKAYIFIGVSSNIQCIQVSCYPRLKNNASQFSRRATSTCLLNAAVLSHWILVTYFIYCGTLN